MGISDIHRRDERRKWVRRKAVDLYDQGVRTEDLEGPDLFCYLKQMEERYGA